MTTQTEQSADHNHEQTHADPEPDNDNETKPAGCLAAAFKLLTGLFGPEEKDGAGSSPAAAGTTYPYRRKDYLLTKGEGAFFDVLQQAVDHEQYYLFAKVRLADLLWIEKGTGSFQKHFNRIQSKHIDFVLCDRKNIRPVLAIELDDSSHRTSKSRIDRDDFLDNALAAAGLPLLRVPAASSYSVKMLVEELSRFARPTGSNRDP